VTTQLQLKIIIIIILTDITELQHDSLWTSDRAKDEIQWLFKTRSHYKELELNGMFRRKHQQLLKSLERHDVQRQLGGQHIQQGLQ